jgi:hypothetical protein
MVTFIFGKRFPDDRLPLLRDERKTAEKQMPARLELIAKSGRSRAVPHLAG